MELGEVPWKSLQQAVQVSDESVLGCYEVGLDTQLVIDAGPKGLGLVLLQCPPGKWQPVACHSRQLTDTEQRYSQIVKECMAVRWACEKCYNFLIWSRFTILTDHKPLIPILNNPLSRPPLRIEKWLMYLQQFDYEAVHIPGKTNTAGYLSRHSLAVTPSDEKASEKHEEVVFSLVSSYVPKAVTLEEIQRETALDPKMQSLILFIVAGNQNAVKADSELAPYGQIFPELSVAHAVVLRGRQICIPESLQDRIIDIYHEAHLGIVKSKNCYGASSWVYH